MQICNQEEKIRLALIRSIDKQGLIGMVADKWTKGKERKEKQESRQLLR